MDYYRFSFIKSVIQTERFSFIYV